MYIINPIPKICDTIAGIKLIAFMDPSNLSGYGVIINPALAYLITPRLRTGRYREKSGTSTTEGDYIEHTLTFYVPKYRAEVQDAIIQAADRYIAVQFTNQYDDVITLTRCRVSSDYDSGTRLGEDEGTTITITHIRPTAIPDILPASVATPHSTPPNIVIPGDGGGDSEGGALATPPTAGCSNFAAIILKSGDTLSAELSGIPGNSSTLEYFWFLDGDLVSISATHTVTVPGTYSVIVEKFPCRTPEAFLIVRSQCELLVIVPYLTGNVINANIIDPPVGYTLEVKDSEGTVLATALPYEATETGEYFIYVYGEDCERNAGIEVEIIVCTFTVEIDHETTPGELAFTTDAPSGYTYEWEFEDSEGIVPIVTDTPEITPDKSGIYRIKITHDTCTATDYHIHIADDFARLFEAHYDVTGTTVVLKNINLKKITNPETQLLVRIGFDVATHAVTPTAEFQYSINRTTNTLNFWAGIPLANENVYINEI
jgi:hypothetical protein